MKLSERPHLYFDRATLPLHAPCPDRGPVDERRRPDEPAAGHDPRPHLWAGDEVAVAVAHQVVVPRWNQSDEAGANPTGASLGCPGRLGADLDLPQLTRNRGDPGPHVPQRQPRPAGEVNFGRGREGAEVADGELPQGGLAVVAARLAEAVGAQGQKRLRSAVRAEDRELHARDQAE